MRKLLAGLFLAGRFFIAGSMVIFLLALSFSFPFLFFVGMVLLALLFILTVIDILILFQYKNLFKIKREHQLLLSLNASNDIRLNIANLTPIKLKIRIIDECPAQLQERNFKLLTELESKESRKINYSIEPKERGIYSYGDCITFSKSMIGFIERKNIHPLSEDIAVYPSIIEMHKFEIMAVSNLTNYQGVKRIRRIGHSYEFEQIKNYVAGDDTRSINWKASSRAGDIMVNQYEDERSQPIYNVIDRSRAMKMPFNGMSLLDYAVNTSLVISNIVLRKHDKAGLLTFADKLGTFLKAEKQYAQLRKILQRLYSEKLASTEANYELLYSAIRNFIKGRSLILLYTNFESIFALQRVLPLLRKINQLHLLVVVFFENTELSTFSEASCNNLLEINIQTAAKNFVQQKDLIRQELAYHGIQTIQTRPEELSVNTINKYLELKARGYI